MRRKEAVRAKELLFDLLAEGPVSVKEIKDAVEAHGLTWQAATAAKEALGIEAERSHDAYGNAWQWRLPSSLL